MTEIVGSITQNISEFIGLWKIELLTFIGIIAVIIWVWKNREQINEKVNAHG